MLLRKTCIYNGKAYEREIDITQEQLNEYYRGRRLIQDCFPQLDADDREFIKSGTPPGIWDEMFGAAE